MYVFKVLLFGEDAPCICEQATNFSYKKGELEHLVNYNVIRIFGSTKKHYLLPCHITDIIFVAEVARQYNSWFHLFQAKRKKTVHSSAFESQGLRVETCQQN
jgi:hypothetical protein